MQRNHVILVDENDKPVGLAEKMEAHRKALLHRAISVFIINSEGEWILQKRASEKYHSKGLWTNTCCTHPMPGESEMESARRRLMEEMGIQCKLRKIFSFIYREKMDNGLTEYEYDHVFTGVFDSDPVIDRTEVENWKKIRFELLHEDIKANPDNYTYWFKKIYEVVNSHIIKQKTLP